MSYTKTVNLAWGIKINFYLTHHFSFELLAIALMPSAADVT